MINVKINLSKNITADEGEELLFKTLESQRNGEIHSNIFHDSAMQSLAEKMETLHQIEYNKMLQEIFEELDKEYSNGDF